MKKLYTFLSAVALTTAASAQVTLPYTETFNYTATSNLGGQGGWENVNTGDEIIISEGSLSYTGLAASTGNKVTFGGGGIDGQLAYATQSAGVVYASFIINIADITAVTDANGGYFAGLAETPTNFASTVWAKPSGTGFVIGLNKATGTADIVYGTTEYSLNTPYLIVIAYDFSSNTSSLWVNTTDFEASTAPAALLTASTGTDRLSLERFFIRQDSATETPAVMTLDELRIGTTWASVTPAAIAGLATEEIAGLKLYPNPLAAGSTLNITSNNGASKAVAIYDVLGKQVFAGSTFNGTVNTTDLKAGIYIVKVTEGDKTATRKLIVQ
jgi:Secretion system C-terminal sorting domain